MEKSRINLNILRVKAKTKNELYKLLTQRQIYIYLNKKKL